MRRKLIALPVLATLFLAGCAQVDSTAMSSATTSAAATTEPAAAATQDPAAVAADEAALAALTVDASGDVPTLKGTFPIVLKAMTAKEVQAGTGDAIAAGASVNLKTAVFDLATGTQTSETFSSSGQTFTYEDPNFPPDIIAALKDPKYGVVGQYAVGDPASGASQLIVFRMDKPEPVKPAAIVDKATLPTVTLVANAKPTFTKPTAAAPTETQMAILTEGTGAVVTAGQNITVRYTGWTWADGTEFDSSFDRDPNTTAFDIGTGGVIPCWDKAIVGQKVGSTLELACTATDAYGETTDGTRPAGALVFVVEIVSAA
ncbi:FKBP-type peptidyl-prolyl cis-trans isomerase [Micrococcales bacterium 31B]|nr:FKBP-type peptidyl-prolyl cis-trans isomerase [Micrococcales bacterium 31B]